ncbi:patatin-like phospholipase family protein [Knoellia koreensis]|uniref:Patatin-like phospholipase family protein n=1 Tax=Knoellia koreensis TaxID=2730921 RepID=A0A849HDD5_9MICO|nr:patatin-like phospholipase family protein [Knoellia sp. DB2414S]NNM45428.1 patatin-like phospholipase family protein [Knoellia sp. DB2414S]
MKTDDSATAIGAQTEGLDAEPGTRRQGIALCLSGGGYRAALFHLGALRRLNELGILAQLTTISAVSGGSIVANLMADPRLDFPDGGGVVGGFDEHVARPLGTLTARNIRTPALLAKLKPWHWLSRDAAVRALAGEFADAIEWWGKPLRDNSVAGPAVITGATEIGYGVNWVFEDPTAHRPHGRIGDYRVGYAAPPASLRMADIVAASCALPPWFAPMVLDGVQIGLKGGHRGLESDEERHQILRTIRLTDGGIYDNLALEPVWKSHRTVLASDGGGVFRARTERTLVGRLLRILGIATGGGQSVRSRWLHAGYAQGRLTGTTWALDALVEGHYPRETTERINAIRTDLDSFTTGEQHVLERHGYLVADAAIRAHVPELVTIDAPLAPPHPDVADAAVADRILEDSAKRYLLGRR